ncbi:MAG: carboxymuconolactone decarboxylase family protein [Acidimicrobiales bacterium]
MSARLPLLGRDEIQPDLLELAAFRRSQSDQPFNIYRALAHNPAMVRNWLGFADGLRFEAALPDRDRELLILRTGVNCTCEYEWGQHVPYARSAGITEVELDALTRPLGEHAWSERDGALLRAADELHESADLDEATFDALRQQFANEELIEVVMLVGQYHLVSFILNAFRIERDEGLAPFPRTLG